jgi:hypothetical protein
MCTVIPKRRMNHPLTAKKDIIVYKHCKIDEDQIYISHNRSFRYVKNTIYTTKFIQDNNTNICSDQREGHYRDDLLNRQIPIVYISGGFHSYERLDLLENSNWDKFNTGKYCKFIIPKGAKYYSNLAGCIVSNQIIFKEIIE